MAVHNRNSHRHGLGFSQTSPLAMHDAREADTIGVPAKTIGLSENGVHFVGTPALEQPIRTKQTDTRLPQARRRIFARNE